jgi:hypothetical protein
LSLDQSKFVEVPVGRLQAHVVDHRSRLLLETHSGAAGSIDLKPPERVTTVLEAADGAWNVEYVEAVPRHRKAHLTVKDANGIEVATVEFEGVEKRIAVGGDTLVWQSPSLRHLRLFQYKIDGLFVARPSLWTLGKGSHQHVRRPFAVEVAPALATRPDASLVVLLASWLTYEDVTTPAV